MSSSSFSWRLCCCERHWLKSSASCGHLSSVINCTGGEVQTTHEHTHTYIYIYIQTAQEAAQAEPAILRQLVTLQTKLATFSREARKGSTVILCHGRSWKHRTQLHHCSHPRPTRSHPTFVHYKTSLPESPNICKLDSNSSCLCVSFCKDCSQSAASSASATAASTVSALTLGNRNDVGDLNFRGHTETDSRNTSYESYSIRENIFDCRNY